MTLSPANSGKNRLLWITLAATLAATAWVSLQDSSSRDARDSGIKLNTSRKAGNINSAEYAPQVNKQAGQGLHIGGDTGVLAEGDASPGYPAANQTLRPRITSEPLPLFSAPEKSATAIAAENTAPPEMPGLPFTYAGKLMEDGRYTVFLLTTERSLAVHRGDVLESAWRVKEIRPPKMTFYYLPLKKEASLDIGNAMDTEQPYEQPLSLQQKMANHPGAETTIGERN